MSANLQPTTPRKGLAITSLVLGILSIPTLGLLVVGAVTSIMLGVIALNKVKQNPQDYGGRKLAIAGIITSSVSLALIAVFGILAAIAIPQLQHGLYRGRETAAIKSLAAIHQFQEQYEATKGHFGSLRELGEAGLLEKAYLNNAAVYGYVYTDSDISERTYCVHADRASNSVATKDFVICEDGIIRFVESKTKGTVRRGEGTPFQGADTGKQDNKSP